MDGYKLVVNRRRGVRTLKATAKEAAERAPVGWLRVYKGGRAAEGNRYAAVRETDRAGFRDCAECGELAGSR
eukprot:7310777-Prymnesium_polylepis.1